LGRFDADPDAARAAAAGPLSEFLLENPWLARGIELDVEALGSEAAPQDIVHLVLFRLGLAPAKHCSSLNVQEHRYIVSCCEPHGCPRNLVICKSAAVAIAEANSFRKKERLKWWTAEHESPGDQELYAGSSWRWFRDLSVQRLAVSDRLKPGDRKELFFCIDSVSYKR